MSTSLVFKKIKQGNGASAYALVDQDGDHLPCQISTSLTSTVGELPTITVVFQAGMTNGIRVISDDEADVDFAK